MQIAQIRQCLSHRCHIIQIDLRADHGLAVHPCRCPQRRVRRHNAAQPGERGVLLLSAAVARHDIHAVLKRPTPRRKIPDVVARPSKRRGVEQYIRPLERLNPRHLGKANLIADEKPDRRKRQPTDTDLRALCESTALRIPEVHLALLPDAALRTDKHRRVVDKTVRSAFEKRAREIDAIAPRHVLHPSGRMPRNVLRELHVPHLDTIARIEQLRQHNEPCALRCGIRDPLCRMPQIGVLVIGNTVHLHGGSGPFMCHSLTSFGFIIVLCFRNMQFSCQREFLHKYCDCGVNAHKNMHRCIEFMRRCIFVYTFFNFRLIVL